LTAFSDPVIVTIFFAITFLCPTVNVAEVAPAKTVTVAGTVATGVLELVSLIVKPPLGAGPDTVTVPITVDEELPTTLFGATESDMSLGSGAIVKGACCEELE